MLFELVMGAEALFSWRLPVYLKLLEPFDRLCEEEERDPSTLVPPAARASPELYCGRLY